MRRIHCIYAALSLAALALPIALQAQRFQEPTKEELQMTADPKAPGASAVFLYLEEVTDNRSHFISSYARIKVLTEQGKEWATVEVPYLALLNGTPIIEGRTIHPDGTVIPLTGKASDLLVFKAHGDHFKAAVFNLPSVEVGSILEYKWTVPMTGTRFVDEGDQAGDFYASAMSTYIPDWDVQQDIFVHKAHFYLNPFSEFGIASIFENTNPSAWMGGNQHGLLIYTQRLPPGIQVVKSLKNDYTLNIADVPPISHEEYAPPRNSYRYRVEYYLTPVAPAYPFWSKEGERWSKNLDAFANPTPTIRNAALQITANASKPEEKARKLYAAVQSLENTRFQRAKTEAERKQLHMRARLKSAQDVWNEKGGSDDELAALYLALARAAGLDVQGMQVANRDQRILDPNFLSLDQLDTLIVVLRNGGKEIYLDPGEKFCPFGQLHWTHILTGGLRQTVKMPVYTPSNSTMDSITNRTADLTIDEHGGVTGKIHFLITGPAALYWRQVNFSQDTAEVKLRFSESLHEILPKGISGELESIDGLESSEASLTAIVTVSGQLGTSTGKRLFLPGFFFSTGTHTHFVSEERRETAVDMHYAEQSIDDVIYHLPAGFTVESMPQPAQLPWPAHAAMVVKTATGLGTVEIKRIFARGFVLLDPKEYPGLRDYYQKIAANDQQQLVLVKAAGN